MRRSLPDEHGWWWMKAIEDDEWRMAFVNTNRETITLFDGLDPREDQIEYKMDDFDEYLADWYGPFHCPGTDFGQSTIVTEESHHREAARKGKAIVLQHVDFKHCPDEEHHSNVTVTSLRDRDEAEAIIYREATEAGIESRLIGLFRELDMELDGVRLPFSAAAIVNGIRSALEAIEDEA
jgi:hypothetical protein